MKSHLNSDDADDEDEGPAGDTLPTFPGTPNQDLAEITPLPGTPDQGHEEDMAPIVQEEAPIVQEDMAPIVPELSARARNTLPVESRHGKQTSTKSGRISNPPVRLGDLVNHARLEQLLSNIWRAQR